MKFVCFFVVVSLLGAADTPDLRQLVHDNRIFELRRILDQPGADAPENRLYRGVIACRFGHETEGIAILCSLLASVPPETARMIQEELAEAYERVGQYKPASDAWIEWLRLTPVGAPKSDPRSRR